ncbi:hypothetical protein VNO77_00708 [Canavalia gladiata]|uniref:S-protein homolog n=1 Tax=Canavalia gladiata TaxID=3824 RepID=A0AAN9MQ53_CANGL
MLKALGTIAVLLVTVTDPVQGEQQNVDGLFPKTIVRVQNDLGRGIVLYLHCRSKEDDLGLHGKTIVQIDLANVVVLYFYCPLKDDNFGEHS